MLDLGWSELLVIGVVALIVVGPKDLPIMFRNVGRYVGKARGMAREFSRAMEAAADDAGVKDIDQTLKAAINPKAMGIDALRDAAGLKSASSAVKPAAAAAVTAVGPNVKAGGETEALIKKRASDKTEAQRKATEAAAARALGEAAPEGASVVAEVAVPVGAARDTDGTA